MKIGDLVTRTPAVKGHRAIGSKIGIVVELTQKKVWRTELHGKRVDWSKIDPEPHAHVLFSSSDNTLCFPLTDLEVLNENR